MQLEYRSWQRSAFTSTFVAGLPLRGLLLQPSIDLRQVKFRVVREGKVGERGLAAVRVCVWCGGGK
jgi:hypothetical protein